MILMSTNNIHFHDKNSTEGGVACVCVCVCVCVGGGGGGGGGGGQGSWDSINMYKIQVKVTPGQGVC